MGQENSNIKKKKKVPLLGLWITLGIILLIIVLPITVLSFLLYDGNKNATTYPKVQMTEVGNKAFVRGLNTLSDDGILDLYISKYEANGAIATVFEKEKEDRGIKGIDSIYLLINEKETTVFIEITVDSFHTRLSLSASTEVTDNDYLLNVNKIKLGKISITKDLATKIFKQIGINDDMTINLKDFVLDLKKWQIHLSKSVIFSYLETNNNNGKFLRELFDNIENNDIVSLDMSTTNLIDMDIDFNKLQQNEFITPDDDHLYINKPSSIYALKNVDEVSVVIDSKMNYLIKNIKDIDTDQLSNLFSYLFMGYEKSTSEAKAAALSFDSANHQLFEDIGISDVTQYKSYGDEIMLTTGSILGGAKAQICYDSLAENRVCVLNEYDFNRYLRGQGILGYSAIVYDKNSNDLDYAFFVIDNFYCNILEDKIYFVIGLNCNGFETNMVLELRQYNLEDLEKIYFKIESINYGQIPLNGMTKTITDILKKALNNDVAFGIYTKDEDNYLYLDIKQILDKIHEFAGYESITQNDIAIRTQGASLSENGKLLIDLKID